MLSLAHRTAGGGTEPRFAPRRIARRRNSGKSTSRWRTRAFSNLFANRGDDRPAMEGCNRCQSNRYGKHDSCGRCAHDSEKIRADHLIASGQGRHGMKDGSAYSASKWGVIGLMKSVALELGEHQITVNTIEPGLVDSFMTRNPGRWKKALKEAGKQPQANRRTGSDRSAAPAVSHENSLDATSRYRAGNHIPRFRRGGASDWSDSRCNGR